MVWWCGNNRLTLLPAGVNMEIKPANEEIMTATEVASFLKVSVSAVRHWTREGSLKGYRMGGKGHRRYLKKDAMRFLLGESDTP
jgi:excisionase family DNA binding protein